MRLNLTKDTGFFSEINLKEIFVTHFCNDAHRHKQILKKHWKLIKNNKILNHIFPEPPVIPYRNHPSLKHKLVRAKL